MKLVKEEMTNGLYEQHSTNCWWFDDDVALSLANEGNGRFWNITDFPLSVG